MLLATVLLQPALQCVQQQTGESSGQGFDGDCGCPTAQSALSKSPPPPGWDETLQSPQTPPETKEREMERSGGNERVKSLHIILCEVTLLEWL